MKRNEQAVASRSSLVDAARSCFTEHGYETTTVAAILDRAGMARGALYHYFPGGKADVFTAVFELVDSEYHTRRDASLGRASAVERLVGGAAGFLEFCADPSFARIVLGDAPAVVPGQDQPGSSFRLLKEQVAEAVASGELPSLDVTVVAMTLYGAVRGAGEYVVGAPDPAAAVATATETIVTLIRGLAT